MRASSLLLSLGLLTGCRPGSPLTPPSSSTTRPAYDPKQGLAGDVSARFALDLDDPAATFFDQPWPSDLRKRPDGHLDLRRFPGATSFFRRYTELAENTLDGVSLSPTLYVRFTGSLTLPAQLPPSLEAPVVLVDLDPASPARGSVVPLVAKMSQGTERHVPTFTLEARVAPGFVLRPSTHYALVVRRSLTTPPLGTPLSFEATKATARRTDPREEKLRQALAPAYERLAALGLPASELASVVSFHTHDPRAFTRALLAHAASLQGAEAPRILGARLDPPPPQPQPYRVLRGLYCTPNYQQDIADAPFLQSGGQILRDPRGTPLLAPIASGGPCGALLPARFVMTIPLTPPPAEGYPLMITAHGTGGDALSFLGESDFAGWAAHQGIAVVSTDQPLHGASGEAPRPGSNARLSLGALELLGLRLPFELSPPLLFYNPLNPAAARDNLRQATVDAATLLRLFAGLDLGTAARLVDPQGQPVPVRLRADRLLLAGHSQGSQSLSVLGALDPRVSGVLLSGCGGDTRYGVLGNKEFARFRPVAEAILGLAPGELDEHHPMLALVQALSDAIDPQTYAALYNETTLPPRSVLHIEGLGDGYTPNVSGDALAVALGATPLAPVPRVSAVLARSPAFRPVAEVTATTPSRQATVAFVQLRPTQGEDGHFVIYREPPAGPLIESFLADVVAGRVPRVRWSTPP